MTNLSFVANKVDLRFAGLCRSLCWYHYIRLIVGPANQYVDQCFFFVLRLEWYYGSSCLRRCGCFYKNDFVVFLRWWKGRCASVKLNMNKLLSRFVYTDKHT